MDLRRNISGSITPKKAHSLDAHLPAIRRSGRMASIGGSQPSIDSSRRNSMHESPYSPEIATIRDSFESGERASKRQRLSAGGKGNATREGQNASTSPAGPTLRRGARQRSSGPSQPPATRKKPVRRLQPKRDSSPSDATGSTIDMRSDSDLGEYMLDNIDVNTGNSEDQQDSSGSGGDANSQAGTNSGSALAAYVEQETAPDGNELRSKVSDWQRNSAADGTMLDANAPTEGQDIKQTAITDYALDKSRTSTFGNSDTKPSTDKTPQQLPSEKRAATRGSVVNGSASLLPTKPERSSPRIGSNSQGERHLQAASAVESEAKQGTKRQRSGSPMVPLVKSEVGLNLVADDGDAQEQVSEAEAEDDTGAPDDENNEDDVEDTVEDEEEQEEEDEEEANGADDEVDEDDEMLETEDRDKTLDDEGSVDQDDEDTNTQGLTIPKIQTTSASPLRTISEEDNGDAPSPTSMAADATGPERPTRRLPGRRRALHPIPKVEAALRRQLALKTQYRAVAKQLKPMLAILAERNLVTLRDDRESHLKASEYEAVKAGLEERLQQRLKYIEQSKRYDQKRVAEALEAEQNMKRMRYRQSVRNAQAKYLNKVKHDLLMIVRQNEMAEDEHASENDEPDDVVSALYHVNVHGRRTHVLDPKYDSRSRRIIETDERFNDLSERAYIIEKEMPTGPDHAQLRPKPFTVFDPTQREAADHDHNLKALIWAMTKPTSPKPETKKAKVATAHIANDAAQSLQLLAAVSESAPGPTAPPIKVEREPSVAAATRPTMASLLNDDAPQSRHEPIRNVAKPVHAYGSPSPASTSRMLPPFTDKFETIHRSPDMRRYEAQSLQRPPSGQYAPYSTHQQQHAPRQNHPAPSRGSYSSINGFERKVEGSSPRLPLLNSIQPPPNYSSRSPELFHRPQSQGASGMSSLAPKGQAAATPDQVPARPVQTSSSYADRDYMGQFRQPEQRPPGSRSSYPPPAHADGGDGVRNRSVSEVHAANSERDYRKPLPEIGRFASTGDAYSSSYARGFDPFRRTTLPSADEGRRYSPPQTTLPPHIHRSSTTGSSPLASPHISESTPSDRYRYPHEQSLHGRNPSQLPSALPPLNHTQRPNQQPLPPIPTGLPPPPLPSLQGRTGFGQSSIAYKSLAPLQPGVHYGPGSYGRQSLPPLSSTGTFQGGAGATQQGQAQQGQQGYGSAQEDEESRRKRAESAGRSAYEQGR